MKRRISYMVVHRDPNVRWEKVEENWSRMVDLESATWLRTYYNRNEKLRFCLWLAPNEETLKKIFADFQISWESILEVEETIPDIWARKYQAQMEAEEREDIATSREM
jgi:Nickel responsive protein SCO4226-like